MHDRIRVVLYVDPGTALALRSLPQGVRGRLVDALVALLRERPHAVFTLRWRRERDAGRASEALSQVAQPIYAESIEQMELL